MSVTDGVDKIILPPPHEIRGLTKADQDWIDDTITRGRAALGWGDIKPRPPGLDPAPPAPAAKKKPRRWWPRKATS